MRERLQHFLFFLHDWATYLRYSLIAHRALDYVSMGLGIQSRYRRNHRSWKPHLEQSRQFLAGVLTEGDAAGGAAVLGAGRLYDFPHELLGSKTWQFDLYDYDPALKKLWKRIGRRAPAIRNLYQHDLTGVMEKWSEVLSALPATVTVSEFAATLHSLPQVAAPDYRLPQGYHCIISLNILSQLGLYLRDRVEAVLIQRQLLASAEVDLPEEIEAALRLLAKTLEDAHLKTIREAAPQRAVVICDTSYLYYMHDSSRWEEYPALQGAAEIGAPYKQLREESWLWHIAPQGSEHAGYGEIHEVKGRVFDSL